MFTSLIDAFGSLLAFLYGLVPNYGVSIILITVVIRLLLYPLTSRQARSMAKMQKVQPEIKKIQEKYKNDRQKLNEEMMAFYKEHQINPLAGCLPLLLQFPIFIALFQVLRNPAKHIPLGSDLFQAFCNGFETAKECTKAVGFPKGLTFLSMDLSKGANADHGSFFDAVPFFILIALVIASGYFQSRQMTRLQKGKATPQNQMMTRIFPVFFGLISYSLPAGVVLYFFVSNLWQIGQQALVFGKEVPVAAGAKVADKTPTADKPRLGDMFKRLAVGSPGTNAPAEGGGKATPEPKPEIEAKSRDATDDDDKARPAPGPARGNGGPAVGKATSGASTPANRPNRSSAKKKKKRKKRR